MDSSTHVCLICGNLIDPRQRFYCSTECEEDGSERRRIARQEVLEIEDQRRLERLRKDRAHIRSPLELWASTTPRGEFLVPGNAACVYYCWAGNETLLYVGKAKHGPLSRLGSHETTKIWWPEVRRVQWIVCRSEEESLFVEKQEIQNLHPLYNDTYNADPSGEDQSL